jgi:hypothetical protein
LHWPSLASCIFVVHHYSYAMHVVLSFGYGIGQEEPTRSFWGSTFMKLKKTNFLLFLSEGKHWCIPPPLGVLLYNCHYCIVDCAYTLYELIEALECITTLCISPWSYRGGKFFSSATLSGYNSGKSRVAGSTHEIRAFYTLVHEWDGLIIWIVDKWFNMRPGGATSGKWRISDGKVGE